MDSLDQQLVIFSWAFVLLMGAALVLPAILGKRDWLTAWNFFLLGSLIFTGMSGINAAKFTHYMSFSSGTYLRYYLGVIIFYGVIFLVYFKFRWPRRFAGAHFLKWPPLSGISLFTLISLLTLFSLFRFFLPNIQFVGQLIAQLGLQAPFVAATIAFVAWYRDRTNPIFLAILIGTLLLALFFGIIAGSGRRYLINGLLVPIICLYWLNLRYRPNFYNATALLCLLAITGPLYLSYNALRHVHFRAGVGSENRTSEIIRSLPSMLAFDKLLSPHQLDSFMGQDSVECALATIEMLNDGSERLQVKPLYTLYWIAVNPIPRALWGEKPESLGYFLVYRIGLKGTTMTVGVNVVGQGYYDGGIPVLILYAFLFGCFLRITDELLLRQPDNPFLLAFLVGCASQILGWPRGGLDIMTMQIISPAVLVFITACVGRLLFGNGYVAPHTATVDRFPDRKSIGEWRRSQFLSQ